MTILLELREAARTCSNVDYAKTLRITADTLSRTITDFMKYPTKDRLRDLNGAWANAERVLKNVPAEGDPAPLSGPAEPARLAA